MSSFCVLTCDKLRNAQQVTASQTCVLPCMGCLAERCCADTSPAWKGSPRDVPQCSAVECAPGYCGAIFSDPLQSWSVRCIAQRCAGQLCNAVLHITVQYYESIAAQSATPQYFISHNDAVLPSAAARITLHANASDSGAPRCTISRSATMRRNTVRHAASYCGWVHHDATLTIAMHR